MRLVEKCCLDEATAGQVGLAVEEICMNIVQHAGLDKVRGKIEVEIKECEDCMVICISDTGSPFNPLEWESPDVQISAADRQIGGLGIFLARGMTDQIHYERRDNKNYVTLKKGLSRSKVDDHEN